MKEPHTLEGSLILGRYRIIKPLARGGMGMVYLGRVEGAAGFAKPVVIKRVLSHLNSADDSGQAQFIREARLLSGLQHPGIVGVLDFGEENGTHVMVLEYVHGFHLGHWLKFLLKSGRRMDYRHAVVIIRKTLAALGHAHKNRTPEGEPRPIIHRDVSPANILLDLDGNAHLLDFGIARAEGDTDEFKTEDGLVKGKLPYIAPEVYQSKPATSKSDLYAVGVVMYQLLSGKNPFAGGDMSAIVTRVLQERPPPLSVLREDLPPGLDEVLGKALEKDPAQRYGSAEEFAEELGTLLEQSEYEVAADLREVVHRDFSSELPQRLNLESLSSLDGAWREAANGPSSLQQSSRPPVPDSYPHLDRAAALAPSERTIRIIEDGVNNPVPTPRILPPFSPDSAVAAPPRSRRDSKVVWYAMLGAAAIAALVAGSVLFVSRKSETPNEQRYLLVERPKESVSSSSSNQPAETVRPLKPAATQQTAPPSATASKTPAPVPVKGPKNGAIELTRAFAKRQGAIQFCFDKHAEESAGAPRLSVRFQVAQSGAVTGASLSPGALTGTALGACLLGVARQTKFPPQEKSVAFSIPFTARQTAK